MKQISLLVSSLLAAVCCICSLQAQDEQAADAWKKIASWREPMPKVIVLNGCELKIDGIKCRLFGVRDSKDAETAKRAKLFLELYMKTFGDYYTIYNTSSSVSSKDGVPLVWLYGHSNGGWAQEALVEAGLVEIDYNSFDDYRFKVPAKAGYEEVDWKKCFKDAEATHKAGKKPKVCLVKPTYPWPEAPKK